MAQLRQDHQKFVERDTEVIAVGPEDAGAFSRWWREHDMPFTGIPDPRHDVARMYEQKFSLLKGGRMPALAVIDKAGKVRLMHYGDGQADIPKDEEIFALLDEINGKVPASASHGVA